MLPRISVVLAAALLALGTPLPGFAETPHETAAAPYETVNAGIAAFNAHATWSLPSLTEQQVAQLEAGACVRIREVGDPDEPQRVLGFVLTDVPLEQLWVSVMDDHFPNDGGQIVQRKLERFGQGRSRWYGFIDLPVLFHDRHYVVDVRDNHALARATGDRAWEHIWELVGDGLPVARPVIEAGEVPGVTPELFDKAIYTPVNRGAWLMIRVGDRTVLGYHATSVVGGSIPDWLVSQLAMSRVESALRRVEDNARVDVTDHYDEDHAPIYSGRGTPMAPLSSAPVTCTSCDAP